jgi:lipopolysaccharide biosynthesis glycosyltransferase
MDFNPYADSNGSVPPPKPPQNAISVVVASCGNYVPHLAALMVSIQEHLAPSSILDFIILDGGISPIDKRLLQAQYKKRGAAENTLHFINSSHLFKDIDTYGYISIVTLYRLLLASILPNHSKVIYLDCDLLVLDDLALLWNTPLQGKTIAAAQEIGIQKFTSEHASSKPKTDSLPVKEYLLKQVFTREEQLQSYFQAGVLLIDLEKFKSVFNPQQAQQDLTSHNYWFLDQDILNKYLHHEVVLLDLAWNCLNRMAIVAQDLPSPFHEMALRAFEEPKIVHYAGFVAKPWNHPQAPLAEYYWYYLRQTYWYERVLLGMIQKKRSVFQRLVYQILRPVWRSIPQKIKIKIHPLYIKTLALMGRQGTATKKSDL